MVLLSTAVGFYLGLESIASSFPFFAVMMATALVAGGSMALNQYLERDSDAKMIRTQNRPIPIGRIQAREALVFGSVISLSGFFIFILWTNWVSTLLALVTWAGYLFVYTPLKSRTSLSTVVGAVPGALPPVIGWA